MRHITAALPQALLPLLLLLAAPSAAAAAWSKSDAAAADDAKASSAVQAMLDKHAQKMNSESFVHLILDGDLCRVCG